MNITKARQEDVDEMLDLYNYYITNSTATFDLAEISLDEFLNRIKIDSSKYETYICKIDDRMIGFCFYIPYRSNLAYAETVEIGLYIKPEFTGKKYGEEMVKYLENAIKEKAFRNIIASISSDNVYSTRLFQRLGYCQCADYKELAYKHNHYVGIIDFQKLIYV